MLRVTEYRQMEKKHVSPPESDAEVETISEYAIRRYPLPLFEIFKPAAGFFVVSAAAIGFGLFIDRTAYPKAFTLAVLIMFVAVAVSFFAAYVCVTNILCPDCKRKCKSLFLSTGNRSATCSQCMTEWDTGLGSD